MRTLFGAIKLIVIVAILGGMISVFVEFYPYLFSRKVDGVLVSLERIQLNVSLMQTGTETTVNPQLFSFAVAIRQDDGEIVTASAEDRQWAAAQKGKCASATYYPYPPWNLMKHGTFYNARLDRQYDCPERAAVAHQSTLVTPTPSGNLSPTPIPTPTPVSY